MRLMTFCCGLFGVLLFSSVLPAEEDKTPPEAAPLIAMLKAAKASDAAAFKKAFSKRLREDKVQGNWEKNVKEAQENMKKLFGDYQIKDFSFTYAGDKAKGKITLSHKGKEAFPVNVIKEGDEWKLDEN